MARRAAPMEHSLDDRHLRRVSRNQSMITTMSLTACVLGFKPLGMNPITRNASKLSRLSARILSFIGWFTATFMTISASIFAWLMPLFEMTTSTYLIGCALVSLMMAIWFEFHDDENEHG